MLLYRWDTNRLLMRALVASLAVHILVAFFLPIWAQQQSGGLEPIESISFARILRVAVQRPETQRLPVAMPETRNHAARVSFARSKSELSVNKRRPRAMPTAQNGPTGANAAAPRHETLRAPAPLYARASASSAPVSTSQSQSVQTPQPETTVADRAVAGSAASDRGGVLPLGAQQDPILDPGVRAKLEQRFNVRVTLVVTVGEDGRTKHVAFQPPLDAQTEQAIEAILADATWDAAVCGGGVSCEGTATIKL